MKYAIIIADGAADTPRDELGGQTALQAASLPALDELAQSGRLGTTLIAEDENAVGEATSCLGLLGYPPERYPAGEGALAAHGRGVSLEADDRPFLCDFVTVIDGYLRNLTAGNISAAEAQRLIKDMNASLAGTEFRFVSGRGFRNLCIWSSAGALPKLQLVPPERALGEKTRGLMPRGADGRPLFELIMAAEAFLATHDVNIVRRDLDESPASAIWIHGHGPLPALPAFIDQFGQTGMVVTASDVMRGVARLVGLDVPTGPAVDLPDDELVTLRTAGLAALEEHNLVCLHTHAPWQLTNAEDATQKIEFLNQLDAEVVAPLAERLRQEEDWRLLVLSGQPTHAAQHPDLDDRAILLLAGSQIESNRGDRFDEENAYEGELHPDRASDLMEYFLRK